MVFPEKESFDYNMKIDCRQQEQKQKGALAALQAREQDGQKWEWICKCWRWALGKEDPRLICTWLQ